MLAVVALVLAATHKELVLPAFDPEAARAAGYRVGAIDLLVNVLIVLVDHDVFRVVPLAERATKLVYDTRGIWPVALTTPIRPDFQPWMMGASSRMMPRTRRGRCPVASRLR